MFFFFFKAFVNMPRRQRSLLSYLKGTSSDFPDVSLGRFIHLLCCQPKKLKFCLINYCSLSPPLCVSNAMFGARNRSCVRVCCVVWEKVFKKKETEKKEEREKCRVNKERQMKKKKKRDFKNATCWLSGWRWRGGVCKWQLRSPVKGDLGRHVAISLARHREIHPASIIHMCQIPLNVCLRSSISCFSGLIDKPGTFIY